MEYWEFLIQKEGDRSWQPLESPDVQLQEGRYRIVARSSRADTEVDVRITHDSTDEDPPIRRMQKRSRRTSPEGLMVVIPFADLKPGIWEMRCRPDLITDLMGNSWKHTLRLQVLPKPQNTASQQKLEDSAGVSLADLGEMTESPDPNPETANHSGDNLSVASKHLSENATPIQPISHPQPPVPTAQKQAETPPKTTESEPSNPWAQVFTPKAENTNSYPLRLTLSKEIYIARQGQSFTLSGEISLPETDRDRASGRQPIFNGKLRISLRDPQNAKILGDRQQQLSGQGIPFTFSCDIQIPPNSKSRLILGEITLYNVTETPDDDPLVLVSKSFTVTSDLDDLLSAIADNFSEAEVLDPPAQAAKTPTPDSHSSDLDEEETPKSVVFRPLQPSTAGPLPPLLHKSNSAKAASKRIKLPKFHQVSAFTPSTNPEIQGESAQTDAIAATPEQLSTETEVQSTQEISPSPIAQDSSPEAIAEAPSSDTEAQTEVTQTDTQTVAEAEISPSVEDTAFQSLNLQQRFWSRLNAIATDADLSAELNLDEIFDTDTTPAEVPTVLSDKSTPTEVDLTAYEIVVDDEIPEPPRQKSLARKKSDAIATPEEVLWDTSATSQDEPIPMPELTVPEGELIAGQPVRFRIKMPMRQPRLGVKLWVSDLQTRSILESPRWIGDFYADPWGSLETIAQITVPLGVLQIRIEAICVEVHTERQSHKATVDRTVIPANLPTFPTNDLDI